MKYDENAIRERVERVLADEERTRSVVVAASQTLAVLAGPNPTPDGDDVAMVARNTLGQAFLDLTGLENQ